MRAVVRAPAAGRIVGLVVMGLLAACGGGGGMEEEQGETIITVRSGHLQAGDEDSPRDIVVLLASGHAGISNSESYLSDADSAGPFILNSLNIEFPNHSNVLLYYRDGQGPGPNGNPGTDGLIDDLEFLRDHWPDARICAVGHSHGGARLIDAIAQVPDLLVHHVALLDANTHLFGFHDDEPALDQRIDAPHWIFRRSNPTAEGIAGVVPNDNDRPHRLARSDVIPWNVWSCLDVRLAPGTPVCTAVLLGALDRHWNVRPDGSTTRLSYRIAEGDTHCTVHMPVGAQGVDDIASPWLVDQLRTPLSDGKFSAYKTIDLDATPVGGIATADLDKDGDMDIAVALSDQRIAILRGANNASLSEAPTYLSVGVLAQQLIAADVNRDDIIDLILVSAEDARVEVLYGLGNALYSGPTIIDWGTDRPVRCAVVDLTDDGHLDLVAVTDRAEVFLVESEGGTSWDDPSRIGALPDAASSNGLAVYAEDLNADGICDLLATAIGPGGSGRLYHMPGFIVPATTITSFAPAAATNLVQGFDASGFPSALAVADFDRDGDRDVALNSGFAGEFILYQNDGTGVFEGVLNEDGDVGEDAFDSLAWGDLNGDTRLELVAARGTSVVVYDAAFAGTSVQEHYVDGLGGFSPIQFVQLADLNADGHQDIVAAGLEFDAVYILPGRPAPGGGAGGGSFDETIPTFKPR